MHGRAVARLVAVPHRQIIGDRDRLAMRDEEAVIGAFERRPAAYARRRSRAVQKDRAAGAEIVAATIGGEVPLMAAPAELGWLLAFADEAVDRPGVDELAGTLGPGRGLRVALGDMNHLDAQFFGKRAPLGASLGRGDRRAGVHGDVEQRLLDEMRDEAWVGAMRHDGGRRLSFVSSERERALAQRVV